MVSGTGAWGLNAARTDCRIPLGDDPPEQARSNASAGKIRRSRIIAESYPGAGFVKSAILRGTSFHGIFAAKPQPGHSRMHMRTLAPSPLPALLIPGRAKPPPP